jgi:hypothetical protein
VFLGDCKRSVFHICKLIGADDQFIRSAKGWRHNDNLSMSENLKDDTLTYFRHLNELTLIDYKRRVLHVIKI